MAPLYLPRVGAFPIFAEKHPVILAAASTELPLKVRKEFPLLGKTAPEITLPDHLGRRCVSRVGKERRSAPEARRTNNIYRHHDPHQSLHATMGLGRPIILL